MVRGGDVGIVRRFTSPKGDAAGEAWLDADPSFMAGNGIARVHEEQIPECKPPAIHQFSEPRRTAVKVGGGFVRDVAPQAACHGCLARAFRREASCPARWCL